MKTREQLKQEWVFARYTSGRYQGQRFIIRDVEYNFGRLYGTIYLTTIKLMDNHERYSFNTNLIETHSYENLEELMAAHWEELL